LISAVTPPPFVWWDETRLFFPFLPAAPPQVRATLRHRPQAGCSSPPSATPFRISRNGPIPSALRSRFFAPCLPTSRAFPLAQALTSFFSYSLSFLAMSVDFFSAARMRWDSTPLLFSSRGCRRFLQLLRADMGFDAIAPPAPPLSLFPRSTPGADTNDCVVIFRRKAAAAWPAHRLMGPSLSTTHLLRAHCVP